MITIFSYNVNGIRAALRKGFLEWLSEAAPDILCIQETKAQENQIDCKAFQELGYYCYTFSAQKKGYSGVAVLTRYQPDDVHLGMDIPAYDNEGRVLRVDFGAFQLLNAYFPSGTTGDERQKVKMEFLAAMQEHITGLLNPQPNIVLSGDFNICHKPIDINRPAKHTTISGFLPEEREWMDGFLSSGFNDSFRMINQEPEWYSWWSYRANARAKNLGWRIDYHIVSDALVDKVQDAHIHQDAYHSDHCPVSVKLDVTL